MAKKQVTPIKSFPDPKCTRCNLFNTTDRVCTGYYGNTRSKVMVIGEAPGEAEERTGKPFQGKSGQLLTRLLEEAGINRENIYITNTVKCRPPDNRSPKPDEIKACHGYFQHELETINPEYILLLGATALKGILGKSGITEMHGSIIEKDGRKYLPTFHPAAALRDPKRLGPLKMDIVKFSKLVSNVLESKPKLNVQVITEWSDELLEDIRKCPIIVFDIETTSLDRFGPDDHVNYIGIGTRGTQWELKVPLWKGNLTQYLKRISSILKQKEVIAHNGKFDNLWLEYHHGVKFHITFDTIIASHLVDENSSHKLKYLAKVHCAGHDYDLADKAKTKLGPETEEYLGYDLHYTRELYFYFKDKLQEDEALWELFQKLSMPVVRAYERIEANGVYINTKQFSIVEKELTAERDKRLAVLNKHARINWNSPDQVAEVLYNQKGLPITNMTPGGKPSTDEPTLLHLAPKYKIAKDLLDFRETEKLVSTYVQGWQKRLRNHNYLFPSFKTTGTVTGRPSCLRIGTKIMVPGGTKNIEDIRSGDWVYTYDESLNLTLKRVVWSGYTGMKGLVRVRWQGSSHKYRGFLDLTPDHLIRLVSGEYIAAGEIQNSTQYIGNRRTGWRKVTRTLALHRERKKKDNSPRNKLYITGGKSDYESRVVFESIYGHLPEHVHHINGNTLDDTPENLEGLSHSDHASFHTRKALSIPGEMSRRMSKRSPETLSRLRESIRKEHRRRVESRFTKAQVMRALTRGRGILKASKILGCSYEALKRRINLWNLYQPDGRTNNHEIYKVTRLLGKHPVYDLMVEDTHNFIANEICVHNCTDPNIQQTPRNKTIRSLVDAPDDWEVFEADYSQIELRITAQVSQDPALLYAYSHGIDVHTLTASEIMEKPLDKITDHERKMAKAVNFGLIYGMSPPKFQKYCFEKYGITISLKESELFCDKFFRKYNLKPWHQRQKMLVAAAGQVRTLTGRIRHLPDIFSPDRGFRSQAERQSINAPVQGFAAELTLMAIVEILETFPNDIVQVFGTVHDATLGRYRRRLRRIILPKIKSIMENPRIMHELGIKLDIPIEVDIKYGPWGRGKAFIIR